MKVMIVDDSPRIRKALRRVINKDTDFAECENGEEAVNNYPDFLPDWVMMDIEMPIMDGLEASSRIIKNYPNAKILLITQYDEPELRTKAKGIGIAGYVLKDNLYEIAEYIETGIQTN